MKEIFNKSTNKTISLVLYIGIRLLFSILALIIIMFLNFLLLQLLQVSPQDIVLGSLQERDYLNHSNFKTMLEINEDLIKNLNNHFGIDKPYLEQFLIVLKNHFTFNFGESFFLSGSVSSLIWQRILVSLPIMLPSVILVYGIAFILGFYQAKKQGFFDNISTVIVVILYAIPSVAMAILIVGMFRQANIAFAILINVMSGLLFLSLLSKSLFRNEIATSYYKFAMIRKVKRRDLTISYMIKSVALVLIIEIPHIVIMLFFGSSLFVEIIFDIKGIGALSYESFINRDYPVILGLIYLISCIGIILRLISDLILVILDPRVRFKV